MAMNRQGMTHATNSTNLADLLERVLDKGVVVAGDIKIKLVEIELLTIQIRLVICSVERAIQMGMDWWQRDPHLSSMAVAQPLPGSQEPMNLAVERRLSEFEATLRRMEAHLAARDPSPRDSDH